MIQINHTHRTQQTIAINKIFKISHQYSFILTMKAFQRYKSIVASSVSDIHAHRPLRWLGVDLPLEARIQFKSLLHFAQQFLSTRKPNEAILLDITDLSRMTIFGLHFLSTNVYNTYFVVLM